MAIERDSLPAACTISKPLAGEAKASAMVARLVSYAAAGTAGGAPRVDQCPPRAILIEFHEGDWKARGIRLTETVSREPLNVLGSHGQLEQVFLNLLVHAEQSLAEVARKIISLRTSLLAKRLLVEISFSAPPASSKPEEAASILGVTRSVIAGHMAAKCGLVEKPNAVPRIRSRIYRPRKTSAAAAAPFSRCATRSRGAV